jgi:hypothetical protein
MAAVFSMMAVLGTVFAFLDMGFNGSKNADYAGFWLLIAIIGVGGCWWMGTI